MFYFALPLMARSCAIHFMLLFYSMRNARRLRLIMAVASTAVFVIVSVSDRQTDERAGGRMDRPADENAFGAS